jgi:hypothetical protein
LVISKESFTCKLLVKENIIEQLMEMKYLGKRLSSCGNIEVEVKEQVRKGNRVAGCLNDTTWRNKYIRKEIKSKLYKAVVRSIVTPSGNKTGHRRKSETSRNN